jgi:hypothetical protein
MERWRSDRDEYVRVKAIYDDRVLEHTKLKEFVKQTVAQRIFRDCCDPQMDVCDWYTKIKTKIRAKLDEKRQESGWRPMIKR